MSQTEPVSVRILDREYTVGVGAEERESLTAAARLLDAKMREIRGSNRMAAVDRVAVLAALNLAHELQQPERSEPPPGSRLRRRRVIHDGFHAMADCTSALHGLHRSELTCNPTDERTGRIAQEGYNPRRVLCCERRRVQTFALSLNYDHGCATAPGVQVRLVAGSPMEPQRTHLNPGFKVVSHASSRRRMQYSSKSGVPLGRRSCFIRFPRTLRTQA